METIKEPVASPDLIKWLEKRRVRLQKEHDDATGIEIRKAKGARLKQIKDCLNYIQTH